MSQEKGVAVVAGGSAGIGRATARALAEEGWKVAILARGEDRVAQTETELKDIGIEAMGCVCDVSDADAVMGTAAKVSGSLGPVSLWINSAMLTTFSLFEEMTAEEFRAIVDTTLLGSVNGARAALSVMDHKAGGRIVFVGSGLGYRSVPLQSAYCASKHGIVGFVASLRSELMAQASRIDVSMVQLPAVNTPQFDWARNKMDRKPQPAPPIYEPEVAARAILRAAKSGPRELLVGSSALGLVLGNMIVPNWLDSKLAGDGREAQRSESAEPGNRADNLQGPVEGDIAAAGRFADRARSTGIIMDGGRARAALVALLLGVGAVIGGTTVGLL